MAAWLSTGEQRSQDGCSTSRMQLDVCYGLLAERVLP